MSEPTRITSRADLVASVPALLGFAPTESVVVLLLREHTVYAAVRVDARPEVDTATFGSIARRGDANAAILIAIADTSAQVAVDLVHALHVEFTGCGIEVRHAIHTPQMVAGGVWHDLETLERGQLPDPAATVTALAAIVDGRGIAADRAAMAARYAPTTPVDTIAAAAALHADSDEFTRTTMARLAEVVRHRTAVDDDLAARTGMLLCHSKATRDLVAGLGALDAPSAADVLAAVARRVRAGARIEALTLSGLFSYADGQVTAGIAFAEAVREVDTTGYPMPKLLALLDTAHQHAMPPADVTELCTYARGLAQQLGIDLQP